MSVSVGGRCRLDRWFAQHDEWRAALRIAIRASAWLVVCWEDDWVARDGMFDGEDGGACRGGFAVGCCAMSMARAFMFLQTRVGCGRRECDVKWRKVAVVKLNAAC